MIEFELDGKPVSAESGSTILEVALKQNRYIPHFCYHKKLSIAANCRMCLVEVEKSAKPLPACATPVTEGMKVHTCSKLAVDAQKGVMEFLLINHPLDCPICDQGGECQLQDLAVGYGKSASRFEEEKRAVSNKDLGPLVATEMTRCIHCSRCVRFTDEIAGYQELGMGYRNNHVEVMPFIGKTVNSELSGNIIDICPVGALTSKPFRDRARSWELSRRKAISAHDALGSNLIVQVDKYHKVVRVLPMENEEINECWISDRDRFGYEGLYHEERITEPMIKQDGDWIKVDWETAIHYAAKSINGVKEDHGSNAIGVLAGANSTTEELYLLQKLMRSMDVINLDSRLSQCDFTLDNAEGGIKYLGSTIDEFLTSESVLIIGSMLRQDHPLLTARIRKAANQGMKLNVINAFAEDLLCPVANQITLDPRKITHFIAQIIKALNPTCKGINLSTVEISEPALNIANNLKATKAHILIGEMVRSSPNYSEIAAVVAKLAQVLDAKYGELVTKANQVGAELVGFVPHKMPFNQKPNRIGLNVGQMLKDPRKGYVLFNTELEWDSYNAKQALSALAKAETVVVFSPFVSQAMLSYADVILPIAPYTETAGSFINMEAKWQKFNGVTRNLGNSKPAWKVIRVLANTLNIPNFEYDDITQLRKEIGMLDNSQSLLGAMALVPEQMEINPPQINGLIRIGIQGIYNGDSIIRRSLPLQQTTMAQTPTLIVNEKIAKQYGIENNHDFIRVAQADYFEDFEVVISDKVADDAVYLAINDTTSSFAGRFDPINLAKSQIKQVRL